AARRRRRCPRGAGPGAGPDAGPDAGPSARRAPRAALLLRRPRERLREPRAAHRPDHGRGAAGVHRGQPRHLLRHARPAGARARQGARGEGDAAVRQRGVPAAGAPPPARRLRGAGAGGGDDGRPLPGARLLGDAVRRREHQLPGPRPLHAVVRGGGPRAARGRLHDLRRGRAPHRAGARPHGLPPVPARELAGGVRPRRARPRRRLRVDHDLRPAHAPDPAGAGGRRAVDARGGGLRAALGAAGEAVARHPALRRPLAGALRRRLAHPHAVHRRVGELALGARPRRPRRRHAPLGRGAARALRVVPGGRRERVGLPRERALLLRQARPHAREAAARLLGVGAGHGGRGDLGRAGEGKTI
ncbi:MAG: GH18, partial [uncultured Gemmatimonadaceae bacterium]